MDVRCEKCGTEYELDESKLKASGVTVKCTSCGHMFKVRRKSAQTGAAGTGGELRTWLVKMSDGEIRACYELSTLQEWIGSGRATIHWGSKSPGAGRGNRTPTSFRKPDFESGASTSSATPARGRKYMRGKALPPEAKIVLPVATFFSQRASNIPRYEQVC